MAGPLALAYELDTNSTTSILSVAKQMTADLMTFYDGDKPGGTPGLLPQPYYWWEAGAMMGALIDYWYYSGDDQYNKLVEQALLFQVGDTNDYMPRNQTLTEGNDDQGFWGLAVMSAAEYKFPDPPSDKPQWLALAQAVFNTQASRWDTEHCNGGLRWQIFKWNQGFDYKNSISQACFFALGARLALYTGNNSYAEWAEKSWDWMIDVGFIDKYWRVIDGAHIGTNCTDHVPYQFSYNAGGFILGAAAMYNYTENPVWKDRLDNLLGASRVFFTGPDKNIMTEVACEPVDRCNLDQQSFKAYLSRWFAAITKWAPHTYDFVMPYLRASAVAAAKQCVGGNNKRMCGLKWNQDKYDGSTGVGQQMAAMEVTLACLIQDRPAPVSHGNGGTSKGNPGLGGGDMGRNEPKSPGYKAITAGDQAGAAILTIALLTALIIGIGWIFVDETSDKSPLEQFKGVRNSTKAAIVAVAGATPSRPIIEKGGFIINATSKRSSTSSVLENNQAIEAAAVRIGRVRSESVGTQRRLSNMPIGWPRQSSNVSSGIWLDTPELPSPTWQGLGLKGDIHGASDGKS
ncbi:glycoside hydrolase family 76 protein [Metarhizium robertsii]|uniref:mannan endo-1,6-alpha-mannosidase n=2 Tax=Metarhizium robertsii TaxID=568076 RepID=E9F9X1_METRA|nr:glycoside hydrolase family 76 protein [Metarhizium robertsii ARSEF 23]EFY95471.2 glycoside hydrolase family 76 protein [Metarhizium robertsii ARSEF 23]EXU97662.1 glycoside hydrolase family 76 protein [Metarhizium robertsii]